MMSLYPAMEELVTGRHERLRITWRPTLPCMAGVRLCYLERKRCQQEDVHWLQEPPIHSPFNLWLQIECKENGLGNWLQAPVGLGHLLTSLSLTYESYRNLPLGSLCNLVLNPREGKTHELKNRKKSDYRVYLSFGWHMRFSFFSY